jgi:hypothetical protein
MARKRRETVQESHVTGTPYLRKLLPLLERLHDDGCERDKAGIVACIGISPAR